MRRQSRLLLGEGSFFESPRWHEGSWWASDMFAHRVVEVAETGEVRRSIAIEDEPSGLGWLPNGDLLVVAMDQQAVLAVDPSGAVRVHADISHHLTGPANDMLVDGLGRAWVGSLGFDLAAGADPLPTSLVCVLPDGTSVQAASGLTTPNGMAILADGRLMVAETFASRLTTFAIDAEGRLLDRTTWAQLAVPPAGRSLLDVLSRLLVAPDGISPDAEGHVWVADAVGGRCLRISPAGEVVDAVRPPAGLSVFACALGGADGTTLLLCCAPDAVPARRRESRQSELWLLDVEVPALPNRQTPPR